MAATSSTLDREIPPRATVKCFHCGTPCLADSFARGDKAFCCHGCLTVFELLSESGLGNFYEVADHAGIRVKATRADQFKYLDEPVVRERLVNFQDERITRVTFHIPAIHCLACVWLLENLFRLKPGLGESQVNFPRKEVAITFENAHVKLSETVALLASLGYEPELKLSDLSEPRRVSVARTLWLQLGVAGFAFGNLMLLAIGVYLGVDAFSGPVFRKLAAWLGLLLSIPVVTYSARHYWRTALTSLRQRQLVIEVPIVAGIVAIFLQSTYEVVRGVGEGYFDSLCGLIFFLLCGRLFQQKTFDRLSFERDYQSFFPLSVTRRSRGHEPHSEEYDQSLLASAAASEAQVALAQLRVGDVLVIRNGELIPADARLLSAAACVDYSFVTGESEPVAKIKGERLYAGGRQMGAALEIEIIKPVSQSYLTSLWNQEAFRKDKRATFETLINRFSHRFTLLVSLIAIGAGVFWLVADSNKAPKAFASVLIVACPCALALAAPFTLGTAIRALGRRNVFVKSTEVVEALANVDALVFDKTGTLTAAGAHSVICQGALSKDERRWVCSLAQQSTHPLSVRIAESLHAGYIEPVRSPVERAGCGIEGIVAGREVLLGSAPWLEARGVRGVPRTSAARGSVVHFAIDGGYRGCFVLESALRARVAETIRTLASNYELSLLSGDNATQRDRFVNLFGARTRFNQSPLDKLEFIHARQRAGKCVAMIGDGLNDAGALKQSDVGIAVVESISAFSPASDVIMSAAMVAELDAVLRFSRRAARIVRLSFLISSLYNLIGLSVAASGLLSPIVCAILMPVSSVSVVAFACGATVWAARRSFRHKTNLGVPVPSEGEQVLAGKPMLSPLT